MEHLTSHTLVDQVPVHYWYSELFAFHLYQTRYDVVFFLNMLKGMCQMTGTVPKVLNYYRKNLTNAQVWDRTNDSYAWIWRLWFESVHKKHRLLYYWKKIQKKKLTQKTSKNKQNKKQANNNIPVMLEVTYQCQSSVMLISLPVTYSILFLSL